MIWIFGKYSVNFNINFRRFYPFFNHHPFLSKTMMWILIDLKILWLSILLVSPVMIYIYWVIYDVTSIVANVEDIIFCF